MNSTSAHYLLRVASFHFSSSFITQYFKSPRLALAQGLLASQPPPSLIAIITGPGLQLTPYSLQLTPSHKKLARIDQVSWYRHTQIRTLHSHGSLPILCAKCDTGQTEETKCCKLLPGAVSAYHTTVPSNTWVTGILSNLD